MSRVKSIPIFQSNFDDTAIEIRKINESTYIWMQYSPTEGGLSVDGTNVYSKEEVLDKLKYFEGPHPEISAIDVFDKFDLMD